MAIFDYVMLLISVVFSLGLARLLETHTRLIKRGAAVRWSAVYVVWFVIVGAMHSYLLSIYSKLICKGIPRAMFCTALTVRLPISFPSFRSARAGSNRL